MRTLLKAGNMKINGEWANHARPFLKRWTSKIRRRQARKQISGIMLPAGEEAN
jgi:hypothetical protein